MEGRLDESTLAQMHLTLAGEQPVAEDRFRSLQATPLHRVPAVGVHDLDDRLRVRQHVDVLADKAQVRQPRMIEGEIVEESE